MKKGSKLFSILKLRCPACHEGKLFHHRLYNFKKVGQMEGVCESCGLKYSKEPGFFFGAAYVSYGITVAFAVAFYVLSILIIPQFGWQAHLSVVVGALIGLFPVSHALSRSIWLNLFYSYQKKE